QGLLRDLAPVRPGQGLLRQELEAGRPREGPLDAVALLELLARAARAGVVAPDLRRAAHVGLLPLVLAVVVRGRVTVLERVLEVVEGLLHRVVQPAERLAAGARGERDQRLQHRADVATE